VKFESAKHLLKASKLNHQRMSLCKKMGESNFCEKILNLLRMGFFSVVFVAAILAGSGCQVLKKDQAVEFDAVRGLAAQLKGLKSSFSKNKT